MTTFLSQLQWRHATKIFDDSKRVESDKIEKILESIRMTPTSFGLQPYKVYVIANKKLQQTLQEHAYNQPQIGTASHVLVFCRNTDLNQSLNEYTHNAKTAGVPEENINRFLEIVNGYRSKCTEQWANEQVFIALGFAMAACAELKVDSCAIGGFDPIKYDEVLQVPQNIKSSVVLPIGYRQQDPNRPKVNKNADQVFEWI
jgi:nitroreductase/dihydropteridine reductase